MPNDSTTIANPKLKMKPPKKHRNRKAHNGLAYDSFNRLLMKMHPLYKGALYDLGCGERPYEEFFLQFASSYVGVDWGSTLHQLKADVVADLNQSLPLGDEVADTVVSLSVLEHLSEPSVMLRESYRILKPGGHLVLQVPWQWRIHEEPYDFFRYSPFGLKHLMQKAGFEKIEIAPQAGFFSMWFLKFNYFTNRLIRGPRWLRGLLYALMSVLWFCNQTLAPWLDRLDRNWVSETHGYFVSAQKR